jgi:hypothetical protein
MAGKLCKGVETCCPDLRLRHLVSFSGQRPLRASLSLSLTESVVCCILNLVLKSAMILAGGRENPAFEVAASTPSSTHL